MTKLFLALLITSFALGAQKHVTVAGAGRHTGADAANAWRLSEANASAAAGDTVNIHAGTYATGIVPVHSGSAGNPIVFRNYRSDVCSIHVSSYPIKIQKVNYIIVQGIRAQLTQGYGKESHAAYVKTSNHSAILDCYIYGGTMLDAGPTSYFTVVMGDALYFRFIGNYVDRQDPFIMNGSGFGARPDYRGDGVTVFGDSRFCIIEGNTVVNVSHFAFSTADTYTSGLSHNIWRNNVAYNCHGLFGSGGWCDRNLWEGNRGWSPGRIADRGGVTMEFSTIRNIVRYNEFYDDSISASGAYRAPGGNNQGITQGKYSNFYQNRLYHNAFVGVSRTPLARYSLYLVNNEGNWTFGQNIFTNNIIAYPNRGYKSTPFFYQNNYGSINDSLRGNLFWNYARGKDVFRYQDSVNYTLAAAIRAFPRLWESSNIEGSPLWVDSTSIRGARTFTLGATSPCIDAGVELTNVVGTVRNSKVVPVQDASYFHYDWGASPYDQGDSVMIGTDRCKIDSIDYAANKLILVRAITADNGDDVNVLATYSTRTGRYTNRLSGSAPDIGPFELFSE